MLIFLVIALLAIHFDEDIEEFAREDVFHDTAELAEDIIRDPWRTVQEVAACHKVMFVQLIGWLRQVVRAFTTL